MPQRDSHDHAPLLSKARTDKLVLDKLVDDSEIADDAIGFHAQQRLDRQGAQQLVDTVLKWADAELAG